MKEAIITVVDSGTDEYNGAYTYTQVYRIEFEGEFEDFIDMVDNFAEKTRVVTFERFGALDKE